MKHAAALITFLGFLGSAFAQIPARQRIVVVISLDGFPANALDDPKPPIPTLRQLIRDGVSARMTTVNPTVTWPNHTAMVTGVRSDDHGLLMAPWASAGADCAFPHCTGTVTVALGIHAALSCTTALPD